MKYLLMGELKSQEFIFEHEKSLEWIIEGLYFDFAKNVNFEPEVIYWGYLKYQELTFDSKNIPDQVGCSKISMLYTDLVMAYLGVFGMRNSLMAIKISRVTVEGLHVFLAHVWVLMHQELVNYQNLKPKNGRIEVYIPEMWNPSFINSIIRSERLYAFRMTTANTNDHYSMKGLC